MSPRAAQVGRDRPRDRRWSCFLVLPVVSMLQPGYYRRYPALGQRMDHWATSTHSKISCAQCHIEPGAKGFLTFAAESIPAFYSQLLQGPTNTNLLKAPSRAACQKCHTSYRRVAPERRPAHPAPRARRDAQARMRRLPQGPRALAQPPRIQPARDGGRASRSVTTATRRATSASTATPARRRPPATRRRTGSRSTGAWPRPKTAATCHDWTPDYCAECHEKRPPSHVGNWKKDHGPLAKQRGDGCLVCHGGEKFCKECH